MLVYGDPQFTISARAFLNQFKGRVQRAELHDADQARALLIQAGQFEQGLFDLSDGGTPQREHELHAAMALTDAAARRLLEMQSGGAHLRENLERLEQLDDTALRIKIPEGYEFYGLFPEQYAETAKAWMRHGNSGKVLVVGIRSIGTSLSAMVCAALNEGGCKSERITVRPSGHPFQRQVVLKKLGPARWDSVIIADEGPGLSGSSVAAVCRALEAQGFHAKQFHIFPGHGQSPGESSSPETRRWWANTLRWFTAADGTPERLLAHSAKLIPDWGDSPRVADASGGQWRGLLGLPEESWPPAMVPFERPKYLCGSDRGLKVFWKFVGLGAAYEPGRTGAELAMLKMEDMSKQGSGPAPLGAFNGFIAMPWIDGVPLQPQDAAQPEVFDRLIQYVIRFAGPPLGPDEIVKAQDRLTAMIETNTREVLGDDWAAVAKARAEEERELKVLQAYGDGHLAPHEWLRHTSGKVLKTDSFGHDIDHTCVGKQSLLWDAAGLAIEWGLPQKRAAEITEIFNQQGVCVDDRTFEFYRIGYSAFRMGQCALCAGVVADEGEKKRLHDARQRYSQTLLGLISQSLPAIYGVSARRANA